MAPSPLAWLLAALVLAAPLILADDPSDVVVLTPDNFDDHVGKDKAAFVEFYAPWCGHCKKLAPEYEKFGTAFKKTSGVVIGKVDCDAQKELCAKFDVKGYPSLKWFPASSSTPEDFKGGRELDDLISFVNQKLGTSVKLATPPSDVVVLTPSNFDEIVLDPSKDVLVEFYAPWCGHCKALTPTYEKVATAFKAEKGVVIAKLDADAHKDLGEKFGVSGFPTIKWFPKSNKEGEAYEGNRDVKDFVGFINEEAGTARTPSGTLNNQAGLVESLTEIAHAFVESADQAADLAKAEALVKELEGDAAKYGAIYLRFFSSVMKKGKEYPTAEFTRLSRMLSGSLKAEKADELTLKKNIISVFIPDSELEDDAVTTASE